MTDRVLSFAAFARDYREFDAGFDVAGHDAYTVAIARNRGGKYHVSVDVEIGEMKVGGYAVGPTPDIAFDRAKDELTAELARAESPIDLVPSDPSPSEPTLPAGTTPVRAMARHAEPAPLAVHVPWWARLWTWIRRRP